MKLKYCQKRRRRKRRKRTGLVTVYIHRQAPTFMKQEVFVVARAVAGLMIVHPQHSPLIRMLPFLNLIFHWMNSQGIILNPSPLQNQSGVARATSQVEVLKPTRVLEAVAERAQGLQKVPRVARARVVRRIHNRKNMTRRVDRAHFRPQLH
jgi:hypothetical protein